MLDEDQQAQGKTSEPDAGVGKDHRGTDGGSKAEEAVGETVIEPEASDSVEPTEPEASKSVEPTEPEEAQSEDSKAKEHKWTGGEPGKPFPIVGIGASAGGIESLEKLFRGTPAEPGMAFVVVVHLMPDHTSLLPDLLQRTTSLRVVQITQGMKVEKNRVHVIPPDYQVAMEGDYFRLAKADHMIPPTAIDHFFRSLAEERGETTVGIVLSGAGADGTAGLRAIKEKMGLVLVEDPDLARFRSMPEQAIRTGLVDKVLPAGKMVPFLLELKSGMRQIVPGAEPTEDGSLEWALRRVHYVLRSRTGHDFSGYKRNTVLRRIERRINILRLETLTDYASYLQEHAEEVMLLFRELLIGVTRFFREPEVYAVLKEKVFPDILDHLREGETMRIWVPGVATGEEAYSLAMLVQEIEDTTLQSTPVQIFGTDLDDDAIDYARRGVYPPSIAEDVGRERLRRFFEPIGDQFRIQREIREKVVFAVQNLIKDPPFTRLDLISCRNLLIYLNTDVQAKLMPLFRYSLRPHGYLVLGTSETIGEHGHLFAAADSKWRIYRAREAADVPGPVSLPGAGLFDGIALDDPSRRGEPKLPRIVNDALLQRYAPACAVIDKQGSVLYIHGRTGKFLEPAQGKDNRSVFDMAREGLSMHLPALIRRVTNERREVRRRGLKVRDNGGETYVDVTVRPLGDIDTSGMLMVVFEEVAPPPAEPALTPEALADEDRNRLEAELRDTRENLQTTIEELEASNEELKSTNEEYQSTNEELKSANEELETSREELQSLNEELSTLNVELRDRIEELGKSHKEVQSYLNSLEVPTVFLDINLRIKLFTVQARDLIHLIDSDIGRPLADITYELEDKNLVRDARRVLDTMVHQVQEVRSTDGTWYLRRIIPFRGPEDRLSGVVINFVNIDEAKQKSLTLEALQHDLELASLMVQSLPVGLVLLDRDLRILKVNLAFGWLIGSKVEDLVGVPFLEASKGRFDVPGLGEVLKRALASGDTPQAYQGEVNLPAAGRRQVRVSIRRALTGDGTKEYLLVEIDHSAVE